VCILESHTHSTVYRNGRVSADFLGESMKYYDENYAVISGDGEGKGEEKYAYDTTTPKKEKLTGAESYKSFTMSAASGWHTHSAHNVIFRCTYPNNRCTYTFTRHTHTQPVHNVYTHLHSNR
jgi:hypothetical protein